MKTKLSVNTGFAVNRYCEPAEWTAVVREAGAENIQFTADLLNVSLPTTIVQRKLSEINRACSHNEISVSSVFTGAFTRVNHLAHPDRELQLYWIDWFKRFSDLARELGTTRIGSHPGIFTMEDDRCPLKREARRRENIENWHVVAEYAKGIGIEEIFWEPMSISREQGETISECRRLQHDLNINSPLPFKICLDVDHGDLSSMDPRDTDPYAWLYEFATDAPMIHLKQSSANKGGHWPFTEEHNETGRIFPEKVIETLVSGGAEDVDFVLELSFKEREPADSSVVSALKESVSFWASVA